MSEANPIICVNGPVLVFGGCYSNLEATSRGWFSVLSSIDGVFQIEHCAFEYDNAAAAAKMRAAGLPNEYAQALETGLWANCEVLPATEIKERGIPIHESRILWSPGQPAKRVPTGPLPKQRRRKRLAGLMARARAKGTSDKHFQ